jgi:Thioesterase-like superfamily
VDAFFAPAGDGFVPRPHARSPWSADMLHGRLLAGLAAREIEREHLDGGFALARLTTDLFSVVPMEGVAVRATRVRDGRRVRAVDVVVTCAGRDVARASALLLVAPGAPPGTVWGRGPWDAPPPSAAAAGPRSEEAEAMGAPDLRFVGRTLDGPGPHRAWLREPWPLVDGEPLTPYVRAVIAADVANPLSNWGEEGLQYINADLTVSLVRAPAGEWIGLEVTDQQAEAGVSVGSCRLHDAVGPIGQVLVTGVSRPFGPPR